VVVGPGDRLSRRAVFGVAAVEIALVGVGEPVVLGVVGQSTSKLANWVGLACSQFGRAAAAGAPHGAPAQVGRVQQFRAGQPMLGAECHPVAFQHGRPVASPAGQGPAWSWTRPKQASSSPRPMASKAASHAQLDRQLGVVVHQTADYPQRRLHNSPDVQARRPRRRSEGLDSGVAVSDELAGVGQKPLPGRGQRHPAWAAGKQRPPERVLQPLDRLDSACWVTNRRAAARPKCSCSATSTNARTWARSSSSFPSP
jgi:hypothetical protein